jgi:hypothetical protein
MTNENELIQKLMISKKIMEKHNNMSRNQTQESNYNINVESFEPVSSNYNVPQEFLSEQPTQKTYSSETPTRDRILNSKLPDEIKQLMIEHPIEKPTNSMAGPSLSDELVDKAARLMNVNAKGDKIGETIKRQPTQQTNPIITEDIKSIIRETIEDVLRENGLITESESSSNDVFKFRVGQHIFEGKLTKIKKIAK